MDLSHQTTTAAQPRHRSWQTTQEDKHHHTQQLLDVFEKYDSTGSGDISFSDWKKALAELTASSSGVSLDENKNKDHLANHLGSTNHPLDRELTTLFRKMDVDDSGRINFDEFCGLFQLNRLRQTFDGLDLDGSGRISANELHKIMVEQMGYTELRQSDVERIIHEHLDTTGNEQADGEIDFDEFCQVFQFVPMANMERVLAKIKTMMEATATADMGSDLHTPLPTDEDIMESSILIWKLLLAGGLGGIASRTATAPLERLKLQAQTASSSSSSSSSSSMMTHASSIWKQEGIRGFFAGNLANCLRVFPFAGLVCIFYGNMNRLVLPRLKERMRTTKDVNDNDVLLDRRVESAYRVVAGGLAGSFATVLMYPLDIVRARLTLQSSTGSSSNKQNMGVMSTMRSIVAQEGGVRALFKGLGPTLLAVGPMVAFQQSFYDLMLSTIQDDTGGLGLEPSPLVYLTCGATAGVMAQTLVYPLDLLRRQIQMNMMEQQSVSSSSSSSGGPSAFCRCVQTYTRRNGGFTALFRGIPHT